MAASAPTFTLCGLDFSKQQEPVSTKAAQYIHQIRESLDTNVWAYDQNSMMETLQRVNEQARTLFSAMRFGKTLDSHGHPLPMNMVIADLQTVASDLLRIKKIVEETMESEEGSKMWSDGAGKSSMNQMLAIFPNYSRDMRAYI